MPKVTISRRDLLLSAASLAALAFVAACTPKQEPTPSTPTWTPQAADAPPETALEPGGGGYPADFPARSEEWTRLPSTHTKGTLVTQDEWYKILGGVPDNEIEGAFWLEGWGMGWKEEVRKILEREHPGINMRIWGDPRIWDTLRPRFIAGDIPDVGHVWWEEGQTAQLKAVQEHILVPVDFVLDLEAYGQPGVRLEDTLAVGALSGAQMGLSDHQWALPWVQTQTGLYYNAAMFEEHGWPHPASLTWEEFMLLQAEIQNAGIAPWAIPGKVIGYVDCITWALVYKFAGGQAKCDIDNLVEGAWKNPDVATALEQLQAIFANGWLHPDSEALSHTESQQLFVDGKAAMVPCGSWLKREMEGTTPPGFRMKLSAIPAPKDAKGFPMAVRNSPGEAALMVGNGKHPLWAMEFLRLTLSTEIGQYVADSFSGILSLKDPLGNVQADETLQSQIDAVKEAEGHFVDFWSQSFYPSIYKVWYDNMSDFLWGKISAAEVTDLLERAAKEAREDPEITKVTFTDCR